MGTRADQKTHKNGQGESQFGTVVFGLFGRRDAAAAAAAGAAVGAAGGVRLLLGGWEEPGIQRPACGHPGEEWEQHSFYGK